jgi:Family of unknown function (DUF5681)
MTSKPQNQPTQHPPENSERKQAGRFKPGQSGNPAGKPKGARHRATRAVEVLLTGEAAAITRKCIQMAKKGDGTAMRLVMERIDPVRKGRPVILPLPSIEKASDLVPAMAQVIVAMGQGEITPEEASTIAATLELKRKAIETAELEQRIARLEQAQEKPQ